VHLRLFLGAGESLSLEELDGLLLRSERWNVRL